MAKKSRRRPDPGISALIVEMRAERGITQRTLSDLAGVDSETIARVEQGRGVPYQRNALAIFAAMARLHPPTNDQIARFASLTTFSEAVVRQTIGTADPVRTAPFRPPPEVAPVRRVQTADELLRGSAHRWIDAMLDQLGPGHVLPMLQGLATGVGVSLPPIQLPAAPSRAPMTVVHPPRLEEGHIVQEFAPATPPSAPAPAPPAKATRRSSSSPG